MGEHKRSKHERGKDKRGEHKRGEGKRGKHGHGQDRHKGVTAVRDTDAIESSARDAIADLDLDNPKLPKSVKKAAFGSGGYPYDDKMAARDYEDDLHALQIELLKMQTFIRETSGRVLVLFEGRDAAGKGGTIARFQEHLNPRYLRTVALTKPTEREASQWYFQRYVPHLPSGGEIVLFDRSWYNRAVVEKVMGFTDEGAVHVFLRETPIFERMLVEDGIVLVKFWLNVGREMQLARFHDRRHDPLKRWKLSPIDVASLGRWDDYTAARDAMFEATHSPYAPWTVLRANDKRRLRLAAIRTVLAKVDYEGKDVDLVAGPDPRIAMPADDFYALGEDQGR